LDEQNDDDEEPPELEQVDIEQERALLQEKEKRQKEWLQ
jgi:hypothetical protein